MPVPLLPNVTSLDFTIAVEVAWGADLTADSSTWTWTDITTDVRLEQRIRITVGASDEAATTQPASLKLTLDNGSGAYSRGGESPNWPYVRQGTPVRVMVRRTGMSDALMVQVYADSWSPSWDLSGRDATVALTASGVLRRLLQRTDPLISPMRRKLSTDADVVAYWPGEDGRNADRLGSGLTGHPPMRVTGDIDFAANGSVPGSAPIPTLRGAVLDGDVPAYTNTGEWQIRLLLSVPDNGIANDATILRAYTSHSGVAYWDLVYSTGSALRLKAFNADAEMVFESTTIGFTVDGRSVRLSLDVADDGAGGFDCRIATVPMDLVGGFFDFTTGVLASHGPVTRVMVGPHALIDGASVGQVVVYSQIQDFFSDSRQLTAWRGDRFDNRVDRLADETGLHVGYLGAFVLSDNRRMGAQPIAALVPLLRECETVGHGILVDGLNDGLFLVREPYRCNGSAEFTIDAARERLSPPFEITDDDQNRLNRAQAKRDGGGSATFEDTDGPRGTAAIGVYSGSKTFNADRDETMTDFAAWMVHEGTVGGYRAPQLTVDLAATPDLIDVVDGVLALRPGARVDVTNLDAVFPSFPAGPVDLAVYGWQHGIGTHTWTMTLNCGPFEPWRVVRLADAVGDTSEFSLHLDTSGAELDTSAASGASALSVATTSGPLWTTTADDFPITVDVAGIPVTVTAITGATSPQMFTVDPDTVTTALDAGSPVTVHHVPALAL